MKEIIRSSLVFQLILIFLLFNLIVFSSGCISKESKINNIIAGDPLIVSGDVNKNIDEVIIVMKGDDIKNKTNVITEKGKSKKTVFKGIKRRFNVGNGNTLIGKFHTSYPYYHPRPPSLDRFFLIGPEKKIQSTRVSLLKDNRNTHNVILDGNNKKKLGYAVYGAKSDEFYFFSYLIDTIEVNWWFTEEMDHAISKEINVENREYKTEFDTTQFGGGKYIIEVYANKLIDTYEVNIIPANIEELTINRINDIFGTPISPVVTINNPDNEKKSSKINLYLDGSFYQSKSISMSPNSYTNVEFTLDDLPVGTHRIKVGTLEKTIEIKPVPDLALRPVVGEIGIGQTLDIEGTSNLPDNTKVSLIMRKGDGENLFDQKTAIIKGGKFSSSFDTSGAEETVYTITATTSEGLSDSVKVTFIKLLSKFEITDLSLSYSSVIVGSPITATATVKNNGNIAGSADLTVKVDGIKKESKSVSVEPNKIQQVSFTIDEDIGVHEVSIDGSAKRKNFEVKPKPNLILDSILNDIHIGDELMVSGITNIQDSVSILITTKTDSAQLTPQTTVTSDGRFSAIFNTAGAKQGIYRINARTTDGTSSDLISVYLYEILPDISISLGLSQKEIVTGQKEKVIVTVTNPTGTPITRVLNLKMDGKQIESKTLTVEDIEIAEFTIDNPSVGIHLIDVNGYQTQFTVLPVHSKSEIGFQLRADRTTINQGEESILTLSATNIITKPQITAQFILTIPAGVQVTSTELVASGGGQYSTIYTIEPGETKYISARILGNENGKFMIEGRLIYHFGDVLDKHDEIQRVEVTIN